MQKYYLEFILHIRNASKQTIKNSLTEFADEVGLIDYQETGLKGTILKVNLVTDEPTVIFDICSQFGRIKKVKIDHKPDK